MAGKVVPAGAGESLTVVGDVLTFKLSASDTGGRFVLGELLVGPGGGPPPHLHEREDELFYLLEGQVDFFQHDARTHGHGRMCHVRAAQRRAYVQEHRERMLPEPGRRDALQLRGLLPRMRGALCTRIPTPQTDAAVGAEAAGRRAKVRPLDLSRARIPEHGNRGPGPLAVGPGRAGDAQARIGRHGRTLLPVHDRLAARRRAAAARAHRETDEVFYILDGTYEFVLDGTRHTVGPGTTVFARAARCTATATPG